MDDEWVRLYLRLGRYGSQTGVGLPLLQCWVALSVCFCSVLAWMGLSVTRNKEACPISFHIPCSSWYHHYTVQFFRPQKSHRKFAHCCTRWCSLVLSASSAVSAWFRSTYLAVRGMHIILSSKIKPESRVLLYTFMFARAFGIFCCLCFNSRQIAGSSWYTYHFVFKN